MDNYSSNIEFTLLENGLDFILSSIKYLINTDDKYGIKYSILHLSSGIELIFKYRLIKEDWKYVFEKINEADEETFLAGNFRSVYSKTCEKRLKEICGIEFQKEEIETLATLREKRNKLEHFAIVDSAYALKSYFVKVLNLIVNFINNNFNNKDLDDVEDNLLDDIRISLGKLEEFVNHRWNEIIEDVKSYADNNTPITCPSCFQEALVTDDGSRCLFCGYSDSSDKIAKDYLWRVLGINEYECVTKGGEYPKYDCPECGANSFIFDRDDKCIWKCIECGIEYNSDDVNFCTRCGRPYAIEDYEEEIGICDDCMENIFEDD